MRAFYSRYRKAERIHARGTSSKSVSAREITPISCSQETAETVEAVRALPYRRKARLTTWELDTLAPNLRCDIRDSTIFCVLFVLVRRKAPRARRYLKSVELDEVRAEEGRRRGSKGVS